MGETSIYEKAKEHFTKIGVDFCKPQLRNAVTMVYSILQDEEFLIEIILNELYPKKSFEEIKHDYSREEEG